MGRIAICLAMMLACGSLVSLSAAVAQEETAEKGEIINEICPVMGNAVDQDTPYWTEYEGKTIGFCCAGCVEAFEAEPEKYMEKLQEKEKKCIIRCPECGAEIDVTEQCNVMGSKMGNKVSCPVN